MGDLTRKTMDMIQLYARQTLTTGLDEVFEFFSNAHNLKTITPSWLNFRIVTPSVEMEVGSTIEYRLRLAGIPFGWTSEITAWEPGVRFVDEQLRGPYRQWIHEHRFTAEGDATVVEDLVHYAVPGGRMIDLLAVRWQLKMIFAHRTREIGKRFGSVGEDVLVFSPATESGDASSSFSTGEIVQRRPS